MSEIWQTVLPWMIKGGWALAIFFAGRLIAGWLSKRLGIFLGDTGLMSCWSGCR